MEEEAEVAESVVMVATLCLDTLLNVKVLGQMVPPMGT